jgi:hypothetical protein
LAKRKKSKKQRKRERRAAMRRVRQEKGWTPPDEPKSYGSDPMADLLPLFSDEEGDDLSPASAMETFLMPIVESEDLVDEPEFDGIYVHPLQCAQAFVQVTEGMDIEEEDFSALPEEERGELYMDAMEELAGRLLTDDLAEEIVAALEALHQRAKQEGDARLAARAAALVSFLEEADEAEAWSSVGVVLAIFQRSLDAGFELAEVLAEAQEAGEIPVGEEGALPDWEELEDSPLDQALRAIVARYPGLTDFWIEEGDRSWEEGMEDLLNGELYLALFDEDEVWAGVEALGATMGAVLGEEAVIMEEVSEAAGAFVSAADDHLSSLLNPERVEGVKGRLAEILEGGEYDVRRASFIEAYAEELELAESHRDRVDLLMPAYLGEIRRLAEEAGEEE